jgi:hypothetical protein
MSREDWDVGRKGYEKGRMILKENQRRDWSKAVRERSAGPSMKVRGEF